MQEGDFHGPPGRLSRPAFTLRWQQEVIERLVGPVIDQRNADARGEQHRGPGTITEGRPVVVMPQAKGSIPRRAQPEHEHHDGHHHHHHVGDQLHS